MGVIAVDPTSPFTGGAILGDRVRMHGHSGDEGVFIRSMATRGHLGGLARATADVVLVLDAAGKDVVIIETVGALFVRDFTIPIIGGWQIVGLLEDLFGLLVLIAIVIFSIGLLGIAVALKHIPEIRLARPTA